MAHAQTQSGSSSSLDDYQSETAETTRNPDGTYTTELYSAPVQYQDSNGHWRDIDSTLVSTTEDGFDYTNKANSFDVLLQDDAASDYMRVEVRGLEFDFELEGADGAAAQPHGSRLVYPDALQGVDLRDDADSEGVKETLVLHDSSAPSNYRFIMTPPPDQEVDAQRNEDGSWSFFIDSMVEPVFVLESPTVFDSSERGEVGARAERRASMDVTELGTGFALDLSVDQGWLDDPARVFPVYLDPTITIQKSTTETTEDATFEFGCATQVCAGSTGYRLPVGADASSKWRAALQFDLGGIPAGATITTAQLQLFYDGSCISDSSTCGGVSHRIDVHKMTKAWTPESLSSQLEWDKTAPLASYTLGQGAQAPRWLGWDLTPTVKAWLNGTLTNFGVLVKDSTEASNSSGPRFPARRYLVDRSLRPKLEVTWSSTGVTLLPPDTVHSDGAELRWVTESPGSQTGYEIHRSSDPNFTPSDASRLTVMACTTSLIDARPSDEAFQAGVGMTYEEWAERHKWDEPISGWVVEHRWQIGGAAVAGVCIVASAGWCAGASVALFGAKSVENWQTRESTGDFLKDEAYTAFTTAVLALGGVGRSTVEASLSTVGRYAFRTATESPQLLCATSEECSSPTP